MSAPAVAPSTPATCGTRLVWADNARIAAAFAVVLVHVASSGRSELGTVGTLEWWVGMGYDSIARWCVTVFVMLSGYLLLDPSRTESPGAFYRRRLSRLLVPLIFWSVFYTTFELFRAHYYGEPVSARRAISAILEGRPTTHLWYLYMLVGLYACVPFIRLLMRVATQREMLWLAGGMLFIAVANPLANLIWQNPDRSSLFLNLFPPYLPLFILGYYLGHRPRITDPRLCLLIIVLCAAIASVSSYWLLEHVGQEAASYPVMQLSITILPNSFAAFELLRRANKPLISIKFTNKLAELTLGIYTIHRVVISLMAIAGFPASRYHLLVCIPISAACVFALSALLTWVLSSIPYLKRLV